MLPKEKDLNTLKKRIEEGQKKNTGIDVKQACSIVRSAIRKSWMRHPIKLLAVDLRTIPDMNPDTRTKWLVKCDECGGHFKKGDVEVDHKKGEHSLKTMDELPNFVMSILDVTTDDLNVLCKRCHRIKTYAERYGHSKEDAEIILNAKDWIDEQSIEQQKTILMNNGATEKEVSNAKKRLDQAILFKMSL